MENHGMRNIILSVLFLLIAGCASIDRRFENLRNPTEYVFNVSEHKITGLLRDDKSLTHLLSGPLYGMSVQGKEDVVFQFDLRDYYTTRYWAGPQETREQESATAAGRIGTINADFDVHVVPKGENKTLVRITVKQFTQQVGRRYKVFPDFHLGPVDKDVKSDTYFEYLFLSKLGDLLGEKGMPPLKGNP